MLVVVTVTVVSSVAVMEMVSVVEVNSIQPRPSPGAGHQAVSSIPSNAAVS